MAVDGSGQEPGAQALRGVLRHDEPMARHTSWRVGGAADRYFQPADIEDLALYLSRVPAGEAVYWVGLGSNLLVRDGGIRGSVIATNGMLNGMARVDADTVRVEAGVPCAKVARYCAAAGLTGAEFLVGIPGTMGGALAMNAGAFGGETWRLVKAVETLGRRGELRMRTPAEYVIDYRSVKGPVDEWFAAARLELRPGDVEQSRQRIKEMLGRRADTQPMGQPSCGSVFRNPPGDYAGRLIESTGMKGFCIGGACVSEKHANFIINRGDARAADIEALIHKVQQTVERQHGVRLMPEVRIVGETRGETGGGDD